MAYNIEFINKNTIIEALPYSYKFYLYISKIRLIVFIFRD